MESGPLWVFIFITIWIAAYATMSRVKTEATRTITACQELYQEKK